MYGKSRLDVDSSSFPQLSNEDLAENLKSEGLTLKKSLLSGAKYEEEMSEKKDESAEISLDMIRALPKAEKKVLLKRLKKLVKRREIS